MTMSDDNVGNSSLSKKFVPRKTRAVEVSLKKSEYFLAFYKKLSFHSKVRILVFLGFSLIV